MTTGLDLRIREAVARPRKGASVEEELEETTTTGRRVLLYTWRILEQRQFNGITSEC